jgi:energy-coupling factor transport system ATP-binding protein
LFKAGRPLRQKVAALSIRSDWYFKDFEAQLFSTNVELEMAFGPENLGLTRLELKNGSSVICPRSGWRN